MDEDRATQELRRLAWFSPFFLVLAASSAGSGVTLRLLGGLAGYGLAIGLVTLWGERTRPKGSALWVIAALAVAAFAVFGVFATLEGETLMLVVLAVTFAVGLVSRHDLGLAPSLMLAAAVVAAFLRTGTDLADVEETAAPWFALTTFLGIVAATLEHERLQRLDGAGTPTPWTIIRVAFVGLWTIVILTLREDVQWGRLFLLLDVDLSGTEGQVFLVGVLLAALVVAVLALRPRATPEHPADEA